MEAEWGLGQRSRPFFADAARACAMKARTFPGSLRRGADSTPETTSTPQGLRIVMASDTFSGVRPPAATSLCIASEFPNRV